MTRRTLKEWNAEIAVRPPTPNQLGRLHAEFERLGYHPADRDARLAVCAALLGLESLGSTCDLTMGDAGRLVRMLLDTGDRSELPAPGRPAPAGADDAGRDRECLTLTAAIRAIAAAYLRTLPPGGRGAISGKPGNSPERSRSQSECPP
jgi:hypothetical protein